MEIQVSAMAEAPDGSFTIASAIDRPPEFYDVTLCTLPDEGGMIEVLREHENLTIEQASEIARELEKEFPEADFSWVD